MFKNITVALLLVVTTVICFDISAQSKLELSGMLKNEQEEPLEWASVVLFNPVDSTMAAFSYSDVEGRFLIKNLSPRQYLMKVGFVGLKEYELEITLKEDLDLGTITMETGDLTEGVEVTATRIPILVQRDTVVYDARAFNLAQNATVEDLLRRLPGVEVDPDGTIRALGEEVQNVLVDGKRFFGGDTRMATKNIQADAVDKVQVFDRKSEEADFTGIDDGSREKTINLELKEDRKGGAFGYASGAYGLDDRFNGKLSLNRFDDKRQIAILAGGNNINELGFSWQDYFQFSGGVQQMMSGGGRGVSFRGGNTLVGQGPQTGFLTSYSAGLQFSQSYGKENEINASYFFGLSDRVNERELNRDNFLPGDQVLRTTEEALNESKNYDHRLNVRLDQNIGNRSALRLNTALSYTLRDEFRATDQTNQNTFEKTQNISDQEFSGDGENIDWNGSLTFRHRFPTRGRVLATSFSGNYGKNQQDGYLMAFNQLIRDEQTESTEDIDERQDQNNSSYGMGADFQYTEPLSDKLFLTTQYIFNNSVRSNMREVIDLSDENNPVLVPALSQEYDSDFLYHRMGVSLRMVTDKSNLNGGLDYQLSTLEGEVKGNDHPVKRNFDYLLPRVSWNYEVHRGKNMNLSYSTSLREPSVIQLQDIIDNSDPLNLYQGNPDLEPQYTHRLSYRYTTFDMLTFRNFFLFGNVSYTQNRIRESIAFDDQLRRVRKPVNVDDDWNLSGSVNYGRPIGNTGIRANLRLGASYNWGNTIVNEVESETRTFTPTANLRLNYDLKEWLNINLRTNVTNSNTRYLEMDGLDQSFQSYRHSADIRTNFDEDKWQIETGLDLNQYRSDDGLFDDDILIWNASVSRFFMEDKRIQVKLLGVDLLNRNVGFNRSTDLNYIEEERTLSLGRYVMLEVRYNINSAANPAASRGGMFRMFSRMMN
nr:TonB-dependent receptor [Saprospiraceae bacterium]